LTVADRRVNRTDATDLLKELDNRVIPELVTGITRAR